MLKFNVIESTIGQVQEAFKNGTLTCEELVRVYLNRIEENNLNSIISVNPNALKIARELDADLAAGKPMGPLHGIPVLVKDNCETEDMPTTAGSKSLEGLNTGRNADIVKSLINAKAVILAKTNLHEFAIWGETISSMLGQTLNPYDTSRTPGGSSGGTGAAVADNLGLVGIGTDTVNSIRSPASACCLCGIRPTVGLFSGEGIIPYSNTQDVAGPLARTVEDAVRVLSVLAGEDYINHLKTDGLSGKRLGVIHNFFGKEAINAPVTEVMAKAMLSLEEAGAVLVDIHDKIDSDWLVREVSVHLHELKAHLGEYLSSISSVPSISSIEDILNSGKHSPSIKDSLQVANKLDIDSAVYKERLKLREDVKQMVIDILNKNQLDAFIFPHQQQLVCKVGESQQQRNGALGSVTGYPAIVVPGGFADGIPVGLEILGRPFDERRIIEIAYGFEQNTMVRRSP